MLYFLLAKSKGEAKALALFVRVWYNIIKGNLIGGIYEIII